MTCPTHDQCHEEISILKKLVLESWEQRFWRIERPTLERALNNEIERRRKDVSGKEA